MTFFLCSVALIIGDEDVETSLCLIGVGGTCFLPTWEGNLIALAFFFKNAAWYGSFQW